MIIQKENNNTDGNQQQTLTPGYGHTHTTVLGKTFVLVPSPYIMCKQHTFTTNSRNQLKRAGLSHQN